MVNGLRLSIVASKSNEQIVELELFQRDFRQNTDPNLIKNLAFGDASTAIALWKGAEKESMLRVLHASSFFAASE